MATKTKTAETGNALAIVPRKNAGAGKSRLFEVTDNADRIKEMCAVIRKDDAALRSKVAIAATSAILHAVIHSNITPIIDVMNALSDGDGKHPWRLNAMRQWFVDVGPVSFPVKPDGKIDKTTVELNRDKRQRQAKNLDNDRAFFIKSLLDRPFWLHKPEEKPFSGFDFDEQLDRLIQRAIKEEKKLKDRSEEERAKVKLGKLHQIRLAMLEADGPPAGVAVN